MIAPQSIPPSLFFLMTAFVAFITGLSKGGLGGMLGALVTPLMALVMPANQVVGLVLPMLMIADVFAVTAHWKHWDWKLVRLLLPGAVIGVTVGTFFIKNAPTQTLRITLGVLVLLITMYKILENRIQQTLKYRPENWHGWLAGTVAGFSSSLAHSGGPPINVYLLLQDVAPRVFVATSAFFFAIVNWIKVPYYFYAGLFDFHKLAQIAWLSPLLPLSVWLGRWISTRINKALFERTAVVLLAGTALLLILT